MTFVGSSPFALITIIGGINNTERARVAGDDYNTRDILLTEAISTLIAYLVLFLGMTWYAQSVYHVPYQWRRVATVLGVATALTVAARAPDLPLALSCVLVLLYPAALAALGFYLPAERARLRRLVPSLR